MREYLYDVTSKVRIKFKVEKKLDVVVEELEQEDGEATYVEKDRIVTISYKSCMWHNSVEKDNEET